MNLPDAGPEPVDQATPPKRRRRWWLALAFLTLAAIVVCAVLVFAQPPPRPFRFLAQAKLVNDHERIYSFTSPRLTYARTTTYQVAGSFKEVLSKVRGEMEKSSLTQDDSLGKDAVVFYHDDGHNLMVVNSQDGVMVEVEQSRPATPIDRARLWLKIKFNNSQPTPEQKAFRF